MIDIDQLIDQQQFGAFHARLLFWSFLAMMADGFDMSVLASAAPSLSREWHVTSQHLGIAFSASLMGIFLGAPLLGTLGDRAGRKLTVVLSLFIFGLATLMVVWTSSITQLAVLRAIAGIGLGGLMPNLIALNAEYAPRRLRARLVVLMFTGITAGAAIPGAVQAWWVAVAGWKILFVVGGVLPLLIALCLIITLPESLKWLALAPEHRARLISALQRMRPELSLTPVTHFVSHVESRSDDHMRNAFDGVLLWITPLLWLSFACTLMANFFVNSWLPLMLENNGFDARASGVTTSIYHLSGMVGGIGVSLIIGRFGFGCISALLLIAALAIAAIGLRAPTHALLAIAAALAGFCTLGAQFGNNSTAGVIYRTSIRSRAAGMALAAGRMGAIAAPLVGASLIAASVSIETFFLVAAVPALVGSIACAWAALIWKQNMNSLELIETNGLELKHSTSEATTSNCECLRTRSL
ncbi:MAG: MFS transporter [Povalibacter sp.]